MKKEEFPTFLNERPAIIFGRDGRELLVISIGLGVASVLWFRLGLLIEGNVIASDIVKGIIGVIVIVCALFVAFYKVSSVTLEEWAFVWLFYIIVPKVYVYKPVEMDVLVEGQSDARKKSRDAQSDENSDFEDD